MSQEPDDPDIMGLVNVMELIAPGAVARGTTRLAAGPGTAVDVVAVDMPSGATTSFLLRRYLDASFTDADALREGATLESLRPTPVPAPELLWLDADGNAFGRPAMATTHVAGQPAATLVDADPELVARAMAEACVAVSWVPPTAADHLVRLVEPAALADWYLDPGHEPTSDAAADVVERMHDRLAAVAASVPALSHGDLHPDNVLVDDGRLTGIIGWARASVADPRADLAHAAVSLALTAGIEVGELVLEHHESLKGPSDDLDAFVLLALARTLPHARRGDGWNAVAEAWT